MRLWHEDLIKKLPRQQLLGQHRECCALRGNGWGKPHATVNYVFNYSIDLLYQYHALIMDEMESRGYYADYAWKSPLYRGKQCSPRESFTNLSQKTRIYPEHNAVYMAECLENLKCKGIFIDI